MIDLNNYATKDELFDFIRSNKKELKAEKMFQMKQADAVSYIVPLYDSKGVAIKSEGGQSLMNKDSITAKIVINTTNLMDSHSDVHISGLWRKSIKELKSVYHLQEHQMRFDKIITDDVQAMTKSMAWKDLGYDYEGETEALIFQSTIPKDRNPFMFEQYAKGYVKEHSVGMRYVQLHLCMNSESKYDAVEKENWDKYIPMVANKEDAENQGYFWAVTEAKLVEGSAVVKGSNHATPTIEVKGSDAEPPEGTQEFIEDSRHSDTISPKLFKELLFN